jgi:hypothetical protein
MTVGEFVECRVGAFPLTGLRDSAISITKNGLGAPFCWHMRNQYPSGAICDSEDCNRFVEWANAKYNCEFARIMDCPSIRGRMAVLWPNVACRTPVAVREEAAAPSVRRATTRDSEFKAVQLPIAAAPVCYPDTTFPAIRIIAPKPWTQREEAVLRQWDGGPEDHRVPAQALLARREATQINAKLMKLFKAEPVVPSGPRRIGIENAPIA